MKIKYDKLHTYVIKRKSKSFSVTISEQTDYIQIVENDTLLPDKIFIHRDVLNAIVKVLS